MDRSKNGVFLRDFFSKERPAKAKFSHWPEGTDTGKARKMGEIDNQKNFSRFGKGMIEPETIGVCARLVPDRAHNRAQNIYLYYQGIIKFCARVPAVPGLNPADLFFYSFDQTGTRICYTSAVFIQGKGLIGGSWPAAGMVPAPGSRQAKRPARHMAPRSRTDPGEARPVSEAQP